MSCLVAQLTAMLDKSAGLHQQAFSVSDFFAHSEPNACGGILRECFARRESVVST